MEENIGISNTCYMCGEIIAIISTDDPIIRLIEVIGSFCLKNYTSYTGYTGYTNCTNYKSSTGFTG